MRLVDETCGSNRDGLIQDYRFAPDGAKQPLSADDAAGILTASVGDANEFLWLAFARRNE